MYSFQFAAGVVAGLLTLTTATPSSAVPRADNSSNPCAAIASSVAAQAATSSSTAVPLVPAKLAYDCLLSVPFDANKAANFTTALKPYVELQSTVDYLISPNEGYLYDAINLPKELEAIEQKIQQNAYTSEYQFQIDIRALMISAKDGHLGCDLELINMFQWLRPFLSAAAISTDGKAEPKVYNIAHVITFGTTSATPRSLDSASPIVEINGIAVNDFLNAEAYSGFNQDPDANWNAGLFAIQRAALVSSEGALQTPAFYPGPTTVIKYANGTTETIQNMAAVGVDFTKIKNARDVYTQFIDDHPTTSLNRRARLSESNSQSDIRRINRLLRKDEESVALSRRQTTKRLPFYPLPEVIDDSAQVSGYFLSGRGYEDVAVLAIASFVPGSSLSLTDAALDGFQDAIANFLAHAHDNHKTKLIVDVQGNGGGSIDLSLDTYMQLFPKSDGPNTKNNLRGSLGMEAFVKTSSDVIDDLEAISQRATIEGEFTLTPLAFQTVMTPDRKNYNSSQDYYGPTKLGNGDFVNFHQFNWTNDEPDQIGIPGITITGVGNRTNFPQYFDAANIVYLTDSGCGSACTILSELLVNFQGVRTVALGGRPQKGPVQAIGGVKGSQLFPASEFATMQALYPNMTQEVRSKLANTIWDDFTDVPITRSQNGIKVNGRNAYRIGDTSQTCTHFMYEAADCRLYFDLQMTASPTAIWRKVAQAMFGDKGIDKSVCVDGSTGQATSVSGGLKTGQTGPQTPPSGAKAALGWLVDGTKIVQGSPVGVFFGKVQDRVGLSGSGSTNTPGNNNSPNPDDALSPEQKKALQTLQTACEGYQGSAWLVQLFCKIL